MRFIPLAALLFFIPLSAGAQDACTADFGTHIGSPACPYQWIGATTVAYDGGGNGLGFVGMTSQCRAEFGAGARMCKTAEIMDSDTLNLNAIPAEGCWARSSFSLAFGDYAYEAGGVDSGPSILRECQTWTTAEFSQGQWNTGSALLPSGTFGSQSCDVARPVACCKPTPVPSPTSSLMLPIGVSGLAALSLIKNAS